MKVQVEAYYPILSDIKSAAKTLQEVVSETPLSLNYTYTNKFEANIYFKREDLNQVRSYKIRGAYNKISSLPEEELVNGIVCASAGNHAQGVALACSIKKIHGTIFMPSTTPKQKVEQVKMFGGKFVDIELSGDTFDDAYNTAIYVSNSLQKTFVHPFDDQKIIEGQGTIGLEIIKQSNATIDYLFLPVGGGGLAAGVSSVFKYMSPHTKIIGVEPEGAPSMSAAIRESDIVKLDAIEKFVDGAAVQKVGNLTFPICKENLYEMITVPEGKICQTILDMYNKEAIVVEPAGALTIAALDTYKSKLKGKNVVCIVSGSNNDITRTAEIKERALLYGGLKHYFIIRFPQRSGALKEFVMDVMGENDDITFFEYSKKTSRENGPAVVGVELEKKEDLKPLISRMKERNFFGEYLNNKPNLFEFLV